MKRLLAFLFLLLALAIAPCFADTITATLTVTGLPIGSSSTLAFGSDVRLWTNSITTPGTQIQLTNDNTLNASNLFSATIATRFNGLAPNWSGTNNIVTFSGLAPLALTASSGWCSITYVTNPTTAGTTVAVPFSKFPAATQTNLASGLVAGIDANTTNAFGTNSPALTNHVGLHTVQTLGNKTITNSTTTGGTNLATVISNSPAISGNVAKLTNGVWIGGLTTNSSAALLELEPSHDVANDSFAVLSFGNDPTSFYHGLPFRLFLNNTSLGVQGLSFDTGGSSALPGDSIPYSGLITSEDLRTTYVITAGVLMTNTDATGHIDGSTNLMVANNTLIYSGLLHVLVGVSNLITTGTNTIAGVVCFARTNNSSLANGNNAGVLLGTNVYLNVSGPTGSFAICGLVPAGVEGQECVIENETGQTMTIANQSGVDSTAANRFKTGTGADLVITSNPGEVGLVYHTASARWSVKYHN